MRQTHSQITHDDVSEFELWLASKYVPLFGADGEDDYETDDADGGDADDDDYYDPDAEGDDDEDLDADDEYQYSGDEDDDEDDDESFSGGDEDESPDDRIARLIAENQREMARRVKAEQAARRVKAEARSARARAAAESGDLEALRREHEAELADRDEELELLREQQAVQEFTIDQERRQNRVTKLASRLNFHDPSDAIGMMSDDDTGDDKSAERALRKLAQKKPYLVDKKKGGLPMGGAGGPRLTAEDIRGMTPDQINKRWAEVSAAMAASGQQTRG